jgi:hypothetical protein
MFSLTTLPAASECALLSCPEWPICHSFSSAGLPRARTNEYMRRSVHAHSAHNVTHQKRPFSSLRVSSLSVADPNIDDSTFSMSSNVINLCPLPSATPLKTPSTWLDVSRLTPNCCPAPARPEEQKSSHVGECGAVQHPLSLSSSFVLRLPSFVHHPPSILHSHKEASCLLP